MQKSTETSTAADVIEELKKLADPQKAKLLQGYFKTGPGQYGAGDVFLGIAVPTQRKVARVHTNLPLLELKKLLNSRIHEQRFTALEILAVKYDQATDREKKKIVEFYLKHKRYVNNWDLVDTSAPYILGEWLRNTDRSVLYELAQSKQLWDRRIAMIATYIFVRHNDFDDTFRLAEILLHDDQDLIHKAVGWMLREVGKRSIQPLEKFLDRHAADMPRTTLRYAIERLPKDQQQHYMKRKQEAQSAR